MNQKSVLLQQTIHRVMHHHRRKFELQSRLRNGSLTDQKRRSSTDDRQQNAAGAHHPELVSEILLPDPAQRASHNDRHEGRHLKDAVGGREVRIAEQLRQNSIFRRTKERALQTHATQHDEQQHQCLVGNIGAVQEHQHSQKHDHDLGDFGQHDDRAFAVAVGEPAGHS
jgi:hypothetical protein